MKPQMTFFSLKYKRTLGRIGGRHDSFVTMSVWMRCPLLSEEITAAPWKGIYDN